MKILAINNLSKLQNSKKQSNKQGINRNINMSDTFEKSNKIAFKGIEKLSKEVKFKKLFECWGEIKKIELEKQRALSDTKIIFEQKLEGIHNQIKSFTDDLNFVWETIHDKKEGQAWGLAYFNFQKSAAFSGKEYEQAEISAKQSATELINRMRLSEPQEFLANAAEKLEKSEVDEKFQKLKSLYLQKINLKNELADANQEVSQLFFNKTHPIESEISQLTSNESMDFEFQAIEEKCKSDKKLNQVWENAYQKQYAKASDISHYKTENIIKSATLSANLETLKFLKGGEELAF